MAKMSDLNVGWRHLVWAETSAHEVRLGWGPQGIDVYENKILVSVRTTPSRIGCLMDIRPRSPARGPLLGLNKYISCVSARTTLSRIGCLTDIKPRNLAEGPLQVRNGSMTFGLANARDVCQLNNVLFGCGFGKFGVYVHEYMKRSNARKHM